MRFNREKNGSNCNVCPLRDRRRVYSEIVEGSSLAILGEAPGAEEDSQGRPFVGAAGRLLNAALAQAGVERFRTSICNVIPCRPTNNDLDTAESQEALACCHAGFSSEMAFLTSHGLKVVVPLGNHALSSLHLTTGITRLRGSVLMSGKILALPTFHPAFLLRGQQKQIPTFVADLAKAKTLSMGTWKPPREKFLISPTLGDVEDWILDVCKRKALVAVDIETTGLRPDKSDIFVVGLARDGENAISIPFLEQGYKPYWVNGDEKEAKKLLSRVLAECPLVFQNALFDVTHLRYHGFECRHVTHDVLLMHHAIHPELPHNLGYIVSIYGQTPYWKDEVHLRDGRLGDLDDTILRTYNLRDAVVLHQVFAGLQEDLSATGTRHIYENISMPLVPVLVEAQLRGIRLDATALRAWKSKLTRLAKKQEADLHDTFNLPPGFELGSGDHLRLLLYAHRSRQFEKALEDVQTLKRKDTKKYAQAASLANVAQAVKPLWTAARQRTTATGKLSTDDEALLSLSIAANNRLQLIGKFTRKEKYSREKKLIQRTLSFIEAFSAHAETRKLLSTYTDFPSWQDGRVHTSFKIHGTKTGRLASDSPNLQNVPKDARHLFTADPCNIFLEADYSNLELRVLAYLADDEPMISTFAAGENIHDQNTRDLFGIEKEDKLWPLARRAAKTFVFGRNYGGGLRGIYERVAKEVPSLGLTYARFCEVDENYRRRHPAYDAWASRTRAASLQDRSICNAFGRKRILLGTDDEIVREGLNTPIQGTAADIINSAMITLYADFQAMKPAPAILLQVHDSLLVECRSAQKTTVTNLLLKRMQATYKIGAHMVSFPVDVKSGRSWGALA
jgi:uracil-DNA glycosylase family 4